MSEARRDLELEWQTQLDDLITRFAWSPNNRDWVASSAAGQIIWVCDRCEPIVLHESEGYSIDDLGFSADGRWLAAVGRAGELLIWTCPDGGSPPQLVRKEPIGVWIEHLEWHPVDAILAISYGRNIKIWDAQTNSDLTTWIFDRSSVFDLKWHPNGKYLAGAGYKGVQVWERGQGTEPIYRLDVDTASSNLAWSEDGRYLAVGNLDRTLTILDWHHPQDPWILQGCPSKIRQTIWLKGDLTTLVVATGIDLVLWTLTPNIEWSGRVLEGHQGIIGALCAHPHTPTLISGDADGYACVWAETDDIEQIIATNLSEFTVLAWHPHGNRLATGTRMGEIALWSA